MDEEDTNTIASRSNHNTKKNPSFHTEGATAPTRGEGVGEGGDWEGKAGRSYLIGSSSSSPAKGSSSAYVGGWMRGRERD